MGGVTEEHTFARPVHICTLLAMRLYGLLSILSLQLSAIITAQKYFQFIIHNHVPRAYAFDVLCVAAS